MRWTTPLITVISLAALTGIVWHARGSQLMETMHWGADSNARESIPVTTLVEMCDGDLRDRLDWTFGEVETPRTAFVSHSTGAQVYLGNDAVSQEDAAEALDLFQQRLADANDSPIAGDGFIDLAPQHVGLRGGDAADGGSSYGGYSNVNDFKYIPRMQRFGLTRLYRFGRVDTLGGRDMFDRTRFGQQQRELERLRARRDAGLYRRSSHR